jgi:hypothetical protein
MAAEYSPSVLLCMPIRTKCILVSSSDGRRVIRQRALGHFVAMLPSIFLSRCASASPVRLALMACPPGHRIAKRRITRHARVTHCFSEVQDPHPIAIGGLPPMHPCSWER